MHHPRFSHRAARLAPALLLLTACADRLTEPRQLTAPAPSFAIVDAAHGGIAGFYFLPPMVRSPAYGGTFDAGRSPVVTICALIGSTCGPTVATFGGSQVKVDLTSQSYGVNWKTKSPGLDPAKTYRVQVTLDAALLGYADVVLLTEGRGRKSVDEAQYVAVRLGSTLPIRFRIEGGAPPPPPPPAGLWSTGDFITYDQQSWGSIGTTAASLLANQFGASYPNGIEIGVPGSGGSSALFTVVQSVLDALPLSGTPAPLGNDLLDPSAGSLSELAGHVLALRLDVDLGDAGHLAGTPALRFGALRVCGPIDTPSLAGLTVRQVLAALEQALGGASSAYSYDRLASLAKNLSEAFESGVPSAWAQLHLAKGACAGAWAAGDVVTYDQDAWGTIGTAASTMLIADFFTVYWNGVEIGLPGAAGNSAIFNSGEAILDYLPTSGSSDSLDRDLQDPTSTSAGVLGGYVLALRLSVDFSDAGKLPGTAGLRFGDLRACALTDTPTLSGLTVRQLLAALNHALGGGATAYTYDQLTELARRLGETFQGGVPTQWAQDHLVSGTCA